MGAYTNEARIAASFSLGELVKIPNHLVQPYLGHLSGVGIIVSTWTESETDPTVRIEVLWPSGSIVNMVPSLLEHATKIVL